MEAKYGGGPGYPRVEKLSEDFVLARYEHVDRSYDGKVDYVQMFLFVKDKGFYELGTIDLKTHHLGIKYCTVNGQLRDLKCKKFKTSVHVSGKLITKATGYNHRGEPEFYGEQDKKEFVYKVNLS